MPSTHHVVLIAMFYNCRNSHSVVILDNAPVHHTGPAVSTIEQTNALVLLISCRLIPPI